MVFIIFSASCLNCSIEHGLIGMIYEKLSFTDCPFFSKQKKKSKTQVLNKKDLFLLRETNDQVIKNRISVTSSLAERNPDLVIY